MDYTEITQPFSKETLSREELPEKTSSLEFESAIEGVSPSLLLGGATISQLSVKSGGFISFYDSSNTRRLKIDSTNLDFNATDGNDAGWIGQPDAATHAINMIGTNWVKITAEGAGASVYLEAADNNASEQTVVWEDTGTATMSLYPDLTGGGTADIGNSANKWRNLYLSGTAIIANLSLTAALANSSGGTGQDSSSWTGLAHIASGIWGTTKMHALTVGASGCDYTTDGTADDVQINAAIAALTSGRTWREKVILIGDFEIDDSINLLDYTELEIYGRIKAADNCNVSAAMGMIQNSGRPTSGINTEIVVRGGHIDGNASNNTTDYEGVAIGYTTNFVIENVTVYSATEVGIVSGSTPDKDQWGTVLNCNSYENESEGLQLGGDGVLRVIGGNYYRNLGGITGRYDDPSAANQFGLSLIGVNVYNNTGSGIYVYDATAPAVENVSITGCNVYSNTGDGITVQSVRGITVADNLVWKNQYCGIKIWASTAFVVTGNVCRDNNQETGTASASNYQSGIFVMRPLQGVISNNILVDSQKTPTQVYGLRMTDYAGYPVDDLYVGGNVAHQNTTANYQTDWNEPTGSGYVIGLNVSEGSAWGMVYSGTAQVGGLRIERAPVSGTAETTHSLVLNLNGTNYKIPCSAV